MDQIKKIKKQVYQLFEDNKKNSYHEPNWIFPNHINLMIDLSKEMCSKYKGDEEICELACILHDVGLVYKREKASPEGHENRSLEYAKEILTENKFSEEKIKEIRECIEATDSSQTPKSVNAKIVRTADALSQFISIHFFAKATFAGDWNLYKDWLKKKATNNFKKICFDDEIKRAQPIRDYILNAFDIYKKYNE